MHPPVLHRSVHDLRALPRACATIPPQDLVEVSRHWQRVSDRFVARQARLDYIARPYSTGPAWHPDGPVLTLSFGSVTGRSVSLMWDGQSELPEDLDSAVIGTLKMMCSNSRLAGQYLLRNLPPQVSSRLACK